MKQDIKIFVCIICLAMVADVALSRRRWSARRNRPGKLGRGSHSNNETLITTTKEPIHFPYPMLCVSRKSHRAVAEEVTEKCCRTIGVACKEREHIGQPTEWDCVTQNADQMNGMKKCCRTNKKTWRKGKVTDGIDCNHKHGKEP